MHHGVQGDLGCETIYTAWDRMQFWLSVNKEHRRLHRVKDEQS
jgi:hypothetical protein